MADKPVLSQLISTTVAAEHVLGNCCRCTATCTYFCCLFFYYSFLRLQPQNTFSETAVGVPPRVPACF
jgi:hypothetical protein